MSGEIQGTLFDLPPAVLASMNAAGIYSGDRLLRDRPDTYHAIVRLLGEGQRIRAIKRIFGVHHSTIEAVAARERIAIDTGKERCAAVLAMARDVLAESIFEDIMEDRLKPEQKALALGIIVDKIELLTGGATARVEFTQSSGGAKTWDEFMERMSRAQAVEIHPPAGSTAQMPAAEVRTHALPAAPMPARSDLAGGTDLAADPAAPGSVPLESAASDTLSDAYRATSGSVPDVVPGMPGAIDLPPAESAPGVEPLASGETPPADDGGAGVGNSGRASERLNG